MPTRQLKRIWCKTCEEFMLHDKNLFNETPLTCQTCDTVYTSVKLKDIPEDKREAQRERYKKKNHIGVNTYLQQILGNAMNNDFQDEIAESDAGQKQIDLKRHKENEKAHEEYRRKREEELELLHKFQNLGRNEMCLCGSGKKYKKCCWAKIEKIRR